MFASTKIMPIFISLGAVLLIAGQCGGAQSGQEVVLFPTRSGEQQPKDEHISQTADHGHQENGAVELSPANLPAGEKLQVVATTTIVADIVSNVGADLIELTPMLPPGSDPHTFVPRPQDAAAVANAHLVFINGLHLEEFLDELIENAGGQAPVVAISMNVDTRLFDGNQGLAHAGADPHIWVTPANTMVMVDSIEQALSERDPANATAYQANARAYQAQLEALDAWVKEQIDSIPVDSRRLVTDHNVFGYYADRYGLEIVGAVVPAYSANAEPSAQEVADLQKTIEQYQAKAVFVGATANPILAKRVAEDANIQLVPLFTGSLGPPGSGAETYIDYIRYNTTAIVEALK